MSNPFDKFKTKTKKVTIKSLGCDVTIKEPTVSETQSFYASMAKEDGTFDVSKLFDAKVQKIADCMIEPKMTVEELRSLSNEASEALNEIYEAIEGNGVLEEGN